MWTRALHWAHFHVSTGALIERNWDEGPLSSICPLVQYIFYMQVRKLSPVAGDIRHHSFYDSPEKRGTMAELSAVAECNQGIKLLRAGQSAEALEYLRDAAELKQQNPYSLSFPGVGVARGLRKWTAAGELCETALSSKRGQAQLTLNLAEVRVSAGRRANEVAVLDRGLLYLKGDACISGTPPNGVPNKFTLTAEQRQQIVTNKRQQGFSLIELMIVVLILGVLLAIAVSSVESITRIYRIAGDGRGIAAELVVARMRAAADFTHARVYVDLTGNTFHLEVWNKAGGCWRTDGDANACTQATSPVTPLAQGDTFGFGSITLGPTAATGATAQAPACTAGVAGTAAGANIANTACIEINSRGYPVDSTNKIVASNAIYITNNQKLYSAIAVSLSGQPTAYSYSGSTWAPL